MAQKMIVNEKGEITPVTNAPQIFPLMGEAMRKISAISKDSVNQTQGFKYRGIDAVMNALYPVMSELGLFIVPEVLEQTREERTTVKTYNNQEKRTTLLYSILKVKYTMYAPDGSNVSCVVIGEGMDSGDKASNKALSVGLKYACFQMFMIPTEEMIDPDNESHEVEPKNKQDKQDKPAGTPNEPRSIVPANVETSPKLPDAKKPEPQLSPVQMYLSKERDTLRQMREIDALKNNAIWNAQIKALREAKMIPAKALSSYTQAEAEDLVACMYANFEPCGTVLKNVGETA